MIDVNIAILRQIKDIKIRQINSLRSLLLYGLAAATAALLIVVYAKRRVGPHTS